MAVFNSLGSNYDFGFVLKTLFAKNNKKYHSDLKALLEEKYGGEAVLLSKGREALRLALRFINKPKEFTVGICGFTCFAVYEAVVKEGYDVEYLDIADGDLNFSFDTLYSAFEKNPKIKILTIQNTLGFPCDIEKIAEFCREKNIILIEDLAHSVGAKYSDGREAGTVGDFVAFSFSQDKMIDGVSGGALVIRNSEFAKKVFDVSLHSVDSTRQIIDRFYPTFTYKIRKTYAIGIGKLLHAFLKTANLLSKPMNNVGTDTLYELPSWYCSLIVNEFRNLEKNLGHRKKIASIYINMLSKKVLFNSLSEQTSNSSNIRFPIVIENRQNLIIYLKKYNIFVSDIWYDSPIAPKKYMKLTNYKNQCPVSEKISSQILNLPTHRNVSENDAKFIAEKINKWLELQ